MTSEQVRRMSMTERVEAWKVLNEAERTDFIPLRKAEELKRLTPILLAEAILRNLVTERGPGKGTYYCPYCVDWMPFRTHGWTGYTRCCGCSMTTMDYYIRSDNNLWK